MGDPGSEGEESNSDVNMDDVYHKVSLSRISNATNEPNRSLAWQVVHSKKGARRSSSNDSDGESSQSKYRYSVLSDRQGLPNIDYTPTEQVDQTTNDINKDSGEGLNFE